MFKKFRKNLLQLVLIIISLYLFVLVFLYFYQRNLLYHPNENNYSGDKISVKIEKVKIKTKLRKIASIYKNSFHTLIQLFL